jgi:hypothetical protein
MQLYSVSGFPREWAFCLDKRLKLMLTAIYPQPRLQEPSPE